MNAKNRPIHPINNPDIPRMPDNCSITWDAVSLFGSDGTTVDMTVLRCRAHTYTNLICVYKYGNVFRIVRTPHRIAPGVDTHAVHKFNVASGYLPNEDDTKKVREEEARRTSVSRTRRIVYEYAACNEWDSFCTITLDGEKWNRNNPEGLQASVKDEAKKWRALQKGRADRYAYLLVPEAHKNGAIHLHGLVKAIPAEYLVQYTMEDVTSDRNLPEYICKKVRNGERIYHCTEWDRLYGYNVIEPIKDLDKAASYISKYISKSVDSFGVQSEFVPKTRYWHSRGLRRAEKVATYQAPSRVPAEVKAYRQLMTSMAAATKHGRILHEETPVPYFKDTNNKDIPLIMTTIINGTEHSQEQILGALSSRYLRIDRQEVQHEKPAA